MGRYDNVYTFQECQNIINKITKNYEVVDIIEKEHKKENVCVISCGNEDHELIYKRCYGLKKLKNIECEDCKIKRWLLERKQIVENKFKNTRYIFDRFDNNSIDKKEQYVFFNDIDGYKYRIRYEVLFNLSNKDLTSKNMYFMLVLKTNSYSLDNIKNWISLNCEHSEFVSGEYINNEEKSINMKCLKCNEIYKINWNSLQSGRGCNKCCDNFKKTNEEFLKQVFNLVGNEYTFLEEYDGTIKAILVKHNVCGYEYPVAPVQFLNAGNRCPKCAGTIEIKEDEFRERLFKKHENKISLIGNYEGWRKPNKFICNSCNYEMIKEPKTLCNEKYGCRECYNKSKLLSGNHEYTGTTKTNEYMRAIIDQWKIQHFIKYNNMCAISGSRYDKIVHHLSVPFVKIYNDCHKFLKIKQKRYIKEYEESDLLKIRDLIIERHKNVIGIVLNNEIHHEFHCKYGFFNNTMEQFEEFCLSKGKILKDILK